MSVSSKHFRFRLMHHRMDNNIMHTLALPLHENRKEGEKEASPEKHEEEQYRGK